MRPALRILRAGLQTTVQDLGRWGHQGAGIPVAGPMDPYSHRLANRLAGNHDAAAALEVTLIGPEVEALEHLICAVAGAEFELSAGGREVPCGRAFELPRGGRLRFGRRLAGARATLAVRGGVDAPPVLGSRATSLAGRMGPFGGRALAAGDTLAVGPPDTAAAAPVGFALPLPVGGARLRAIRGPQQAMFGDAVLAAFFETRFRITPRSNRMGYRLEGPPIVHAGAADILSEATPVGSVQVPRDGQPILLMADRQTAGGYPKIATVITADLPLAGQLAPGDWIRIIPCTRDEAMDALQRQERLLSGRRS